MTTTSTMRRSPPATMAPMAAGVAAADDHHLDDAAVAARDHGADGRGLGALALGIRGVLDVAAGVELAGVGSHAGADGEPGVGGVGPLAGPAGQVDHVAQRAHCSFT